MFDADDLVRGVLTGVMGGRHKRSKKALKYLTKRGGGMMANPATLLTVAGVAWGIFETLQNSGAQGAPGAPGAHGATGAAQPVPPLPSTGAAIPPDVLMMIRLAIAAAHADGSFTDADRAQILERARASDAAHVVEHELTYRKPVAEIVAGVTDPAQRATLYVLAFGIVRADESVSGAERIFLAQLAHQLGLDPATVAKLEADAAARIDSQE